MGPKWYECGHLTRQNQAGFRRGTCQALSRERSLSGLSDCVQHGILAVKQEWLEHELNRNIAGVVSL